MSLLSTKGMYGLSAMYELSLIKTDKPTQIKEISAKAGIPQNYLEQLLVVLRRAELVTSVRGAHGGYFLARKANDILVKDIFIALEGNLNIVESKVDNPVLNLFYKESNDKLKNIFNISLSELHEYQDKLREQLDYSI
ncbi:RrF2 family transcriptional regulator [Sulfurospirillum arcachonense]|uniref:RrF2 family transcriptional regulator n=1 Tax=Sulfurospirillum arcachonense TaxID=57666 RepID=UPI000469EE99|nr:Rrf2 family transcriptional regulator [Sulfurospirillum arcachonense]